MKRKLLIILGFLIVIPLLVLIVRLIITSTIPKQGVLKVSTNVAARVFIENKDIGKTPLEQKIDAGDYAIRLVPETSDQNITSWQGRVFINKDTLTYINRDLSESELTSAGEQLWIEKISGNGSELSMLSIPDGANIILDDQPKGVTPLTLTDVTPGDHSLVVTSPGFEPRTAKITLTPGYKVVASFSLAISPSQLSTPQTMPSEEASSSASIVEPTPIEAASPAPSPTKTAVSNATAGTTVEILDTPVGFLRVREEPSTASEELGRVNPGETYEVIEKQGTWYKISFDGNEGWISSQYAKEVE